MVIIPHTDFRSKIKINLQNKNFMKMLSRKCFKKDFSFFSQALCSFDKGFYSKENKKVLFQKLEFPVLPKKGKLSKKDKEIEFSKEFIKYRKKHSAVESAINALEVHGLDKCFDKGFYGFRRYVALAIASRNIQKLGFHLKIKEIKNLKKHRIKIAG